MEKNLKKENPYNLKKIKCPFCSKIFAESNLQYNFDLTTTQPTNRHICHGCKRSILYSITTKNDDMLSKS